MSQQIIQSVHELIDSVFAMRVAAHLLLSEDRQGCLELLQLIERTADRSLWALDQIMVADEATAFPSLDKLS